MILWSFFISILILDNHVKSYVTRTALGRVTVRKTGMQDVVQDESTIFEDDKYRSNNWLSIFAPVVEEIMAEESLSQQYNYLNYDVRPVVTGDLYKSIKSLVDESPSFETLSNNRKQIPTVLKSNFLPSIGAWREITPAEEDDQKAPPSLAAYLSDISILSARYEEEIEELWNKYVDKGTLLYLKEGELNLLREAFSIAYIALWGKKTQRTLEVSINRAAGTAVALGEMNADIDVILAGILQDAFSECNLSDNATLKDYINNRFGKVVLDIVQKYNKLPKFKAMTEDYTPMQSENKIQMLIAFAEDYRTLYIRLADRLHTMREVRELPLDDFEINKIALEALHVYAPLAHKMGVMKLKEELETRAFSIIDRPMYMRTKVTRLAANKAYHDVFDILSNIVKNDQFLQEQNSTILITYRIKSNYQLYLKMKRKNLNSLSEVRDALGIRLIIDSPKQGHESADDYEERCHRLCYHVLNHLNSLDGWKPADNGFKDYIKHRKRNGYQSIHQYIRNDILRANVEVQIRTKKMHMDAELGEAAHWYYKDLIYRSEVADTKLYKRAWRSDQQIKAKSPAELIGIAKQQLLSSRVFVFLNDKATVLNLKQGSTALDAAFAIHSKLGLTASFVNINSCPVDFSTPLSNGDVISVQSSSDGRITAHESWFNDVKSPLAINSLKRYFRDSQKALYITLGCVQLMMTITLNKDRIMSKFHAIPDARDLSHMVRSNTIYSNLSTLLMQLGSASAKSDVAQIMSGLLGIPVEELSVNTISVSLAWAKLQGKNGWANKHIRSVILLPMLRELLPSLGINNIESRWIELIGSKSLTDEESPYFKALSAHLMSPVSKSSSVSKYLSKMKYLSPKHDLINTGSKTNNKQNISIVGNNRLSSTKAYTNHVFSSTSINGNSLMSSPKSSINNTEKDELIKNGIDAMESFKSFLMTATPISSSISENIETIIESRIDGNINIKKLSNEVSVEV